MSKLMESKVKYLVLLLSLIYITAGISFLRVQIIENGMKPYQNINGDEVTGELEFLLHVKEPDEFLLLHSAKYATGNVKFDLSKEPSNGEAGESVVYYNLGSGDFINKVVELNEGIYHCIISRETTDHKESLRFFFDRGSIKQEYIKKDLSINNYN